MISSLLSAQAVTLTRSQREFRSAVVPVPADAARLTVRLKRPTALDLLGWDALSKLRVTLVCVVDGVEYRCEGEATGGVRVSLKGVEFSHYSLSYNLPVLLGDAAREFMATATKDAEGYYSDVPLTRIGEPASSVSAYVLVEHVSGGRVDTEIEAEVESLPAPTVRTKNSVAFDAATSAKEAAGDGVVSLTHTSSGSDRGVWAAQAAYGTVTSTSITYGGSGLTERSDLNRNTIRLAGYSGKGQATGAQTVIGTLSASPDEHTLGVISMTGVDQTTEVGTVANANGAVSPATVTVGSVGSDDMVVDALVTDFEGEATAGADQTERFNEFIDAVRSFKGSTQPGTAGGVMSWALAGSSLYGEGWIITAIAFKPTAGGGGAAPFEENFMPRPMQVPPVNVTVFS